MPFYYKDHLIKIGTCGSKTYQLQKSRFDLKKRSLPMPTWSMTDQPEYKPDKARGYNHYHYQRWHQQTPYQKNMAFTAAKIWGEPSFPLNAPTARMVRSLSRPPIEQPAAKPLSDMNDYSTDYWYSQTPMFHYLAKMLRFHGLFYDAHMSWKEAQMDRRASKGAPNMPLIGDGKIKQLKIKRAEAYKLKAEKARLAARKLKMAEKKAKAGAS